MLQSLLQVAELLLSAPYIDPLLCSLQFMTDSASGGHARPIVGGGLSPLLALLTAQQLADTVHNHSIAVERKQFLVYVGEALESLQLMLVELSQAQGHSQSQRHKRASSTPVPLSCASSVLP